MCTIRISRYLPITGEVLGYEREGRSKYNGYTLLYIHLLCQYNWTYFTLHTRFQLCASFTWNSYHAESQTAFICILITCCQVACRFCAHRYIRCLSLQCEIDGKIKNLVHAPNCVIMLGCVRSIIFCIKFSCFCLLLGGLTGV